MSLPKIKRIVIKASNESDNIVLPDDIVLNEIEENIINAFTDRYILENGDVAEISWLNFLDIVANQSSYNLFLLDPNDSYIQNYKQKTGEMSYLEERLTSGNFIVGINTTVRSQYNSYGISNEDAQSRVPIMRQQVNDWVNQHLSTCSYENICRILLFLFYQQRKILILKEAIKISFLFKSHHNIKKTYAYKTDAFKMIIKDNNNKRELIVSYDNNLLRDNVSFPAYYQVLAFDVNSPVDVNVVSGYDRQNLPGVDFRRFALSYADIGLDPASSGSNKGFEWVFWDNVQKKVQKRTYVVTCMRTSVGNTLTGATKNTDFIWKSEKLNDRDYKNFTFVGAAESPISTNLNYLATPPITTPYTYLLPLNSNPVSRFGDINPPLPPDVTINNLNAGAPIIPNTEGKYIVDPVFSQLEIQEAALLNGAIYFTATNEYDFNAGSYFKYTARFRTILEEVNFRKQVFKLSRALEFIQALEGETFGRSFHDLTDYYDITTGMWY